MAALGALGTITSPVQYGADGALACLGGFSPRTIPARIPTEGGIDVDLKPLAHDPHTVAKIMKRRERERERTNILITPRLRQVGLDIATLNAQVAAKKMAADAASHEDDGFNLAMSIKSQLLDRVEASMQEDAKNKQRACVDYSLQHLRKEQRREYSLSDPHMLKKESPPGKDCGLSSAQYFEGEDAMCPQAQREKRQNQASWLLAQMAEKKLRDEAEREEEKAMDAESLRANNIRAMCEQADLEELREMNAQHGAENKQLAAQHSARRMIALQKDADHVKAHMDNHHAHYLERDRRDYSVGRDGSTVDFKRCTYEQEQDMWNTNAKILLEQKAKRRAEANSDNAYQQIGMAYAMVSEAAEHQIASLNSARRQKMDQENKAIAQERREREAFERKHYKSFAQEPS